jgi:hypothetical protein
MKLLVGLVLLLSSPAAGFHAGGLTPATSVAPRAASQTMVFGRVRTFVSNRLITPFRRTPEAVVDEDAGVALVSEFASASEVKAVEPPPIVLDKKNLSVVDKLLVNLGVKTEDECVVPEEGEDLMEQIKCAGRAGIISYILWEWAFWIGAGGLAAITYYQATGGWPDLSNPDDQAKVGASAFALVNVARFAVPLRIGLALGTTPWVDDNIVKPFLGGGDDDGGDGGDAADKSELEPQSA